MKVFKKSVVKERTSFGRFDFIFCQEHLTQKHCEIQIKRSGKT